MTRSEVNQGHIDEIRKFAPRCTCSECDDVIVPRITDYGGMNTTTLLMEEPHLAPQFLGCEKDSYGRRIIEEGYLDGLTFSRDEYPPGFGDGIFDNNGEDCVGCDLPSLSSLNELFEITLKAVSYHPKDGPSSVTALHRAPLKITHAMVKDEEEDSGTIEYRFQAKQASEVTAAVSMYNVSKLSSFLHEPFECDSRPTSNQLWINYWDIDLFSVEDGGLTATHMSRSDLLWKCGMLRGL